jgi:hypothetical protein
MSQIPSSSSHRKKRWHSEWAQRVPRASAERLSCAFGYWDVSKGRDADEAKHRSRRGIGRDVRHKGLLLGGAANAVVRGWLESDSD